MSKSVWYVRLTALTVLCASLLGTAGCTGLSDRQLSQILQSVITSGLSALVSVFVSGAAG